MSPLAWIAGFSALASIGAVLGASAFLLLPERARRSLLSLLVSYAAGVLLAAALLILLPRATEGIATGTALAAVLAGLIVFFAFERLLLWRHCHVEGHCPEHRAAAPLILLGDALHNFVDGIVLAAAFLSSTPVGVGAGLAVIAHEVPQEVGDFAILLDAGYSRGKALAWNLLSASATFAGATVAYVGLRLLLNVTPYVLAVSAASFLYIGLADLIPSIHGHSRMKAGIGPFAALLAGVAVIIALRAVHP